MNKKNLINLIKKTAQDLEDAPGVAPRTAPPSGGGNTGGAPDYMTNPKSYENYGPPSSIAKPAPVAGPPQSITKMQSALKNLASAVVQQIDTSSMGAPSGSGGVSTDQMKTLGRMSFADFITQHYTRGSDISGVEYDWDPNKTDMDQKDPSKPTRTDVVMNTMQRVGGPKSEFKIDGVWGPRTNASLRNAYALAYGMLRMATDFKYQPRDYSTSSLQELKSLIPHAANDLSEKQKIEDAKKITPHLVAIKGLYNEIKEHILNNTGFKPFIEGSQAYESYTPGGPVNPKLIADLNTKFTNMKVTGTTNGRDTTIPIAVSDLVSVQSLQEWQKKNMPGMSLQNILDQIKKHLDETDINRGVSQ